MPKNDVVFAVMGPSGAGKSEFVNYASRQFKNGSIGDKLRPWTSKIRARQIETSTCNVVFIDTPGVDNIQTPTLIAADIQSWLIKRNKGRDGLAGIIYLHRITSNRITSHGWDSPAIASLCGPERLALVTTMWDELRPGVGAEREQELKDGHWNDLLNQGAKVKRFDRSTRSAWEIIGEVVGQPLTDEAELMQKDLLEQLRKDKKGQRFHNTLQELLDEEKRLLKELHEAERQESSALAERLPLGELGTMSPSLRFPKLVAFDLDYTLWDLWIDTHISGPLHRHQDTLNEVLDRYNDKICFYKEVPEIMHRLKAEGVVIAACSRTHAPALARQALSLLLVPPPGASRAGQSDDSSNVQPAIKFFDQLEIYPGSKLTHFRKLHEKTGLPYSEMLFFDDEHRNQEVEKLGVTFCLVPEGVNNKVFEKGLARWRVAHSEGLEDEA
ncbi:hypothetical protein EYR36_001903 [Pleurotus pulmonarius]|nr:hypothetical protein EYR36_001903 [Pleurotus pulmonarius]